MRTVSQSNCVAARLELISYVSALGSLKFLFKYPPVNIDNHGVDGLFLMCPLITISPETRSVTPAQVIYSLLIARRLNRVGLLCVTTCSPSYALELLGRALQSFMGRVPIAAAQRGKGHKDRACCFMPRWLQVARH